MSRKNSEFQSIRSEGGLLPLDLLMRITDARTNLPGLKPEHYGLPPGERLNEVITQSWNRLRKHWGEFSAAAEALPVNEPALGLTNDKWSLPLLRELGFGMLPVSQGPILNGRTYPISRFVGPVPIHLVGCGVSLDRRAAGVRGAALGNPHGLVQEYLNRSENHLWAIVSNGLRFRILRDNQALSRQSFLEFDLQSMFGGEIYSDFVLLWLVAHSTRFAPRDGTQPESCWLEQWVKVAEDEGTRALDGLREGVEKALVALGQGFVGHKANSALREALRTGTLSRSELHAQLLRIVYRLIFLFVAEDRTIPLNRADSSSYRQSLLHIVDESPEAETKRELYASHYSMARLREMASQIKGSRHGDLWHQFQILVGALSGEPRFESVREALSLPMLGSSLWKPSFTSALNGAGLAENGVELSNYDFLEAIRHLAFTRKGRNLRQVDYRNLGSEEFGSVYEGLLSLTPEIGSDGATFNFKEFAGNERKTSGSYYTPDCLVQCLLDSALDPVVQDRIKGKTGADAEKALLAIKVCDPSVGSGHFLVGAAHRLAAHLSRIRALASGDSEPSPLLYQQALRDVIAHCLYGVDLNPMAVELCKVTLWLEAMEPGKPLSFLDHHIQCGNSLLGATPALIAAGLPDDTFTAIEGDDKAACAELKKRNKKERKGFGPLFEKEEQTIRDRLRLAATQIEAMDDSQPAAIQQKEAAFTTSETSPEYRKAKLLADLWCAAFVIKKTYPAGENASGGSDLSSHIPQPIEGHLLHTDDDLFGQSPPAPAPTKTAKQPRTKNREPGTASGITTGTLRNFVQGQALPEALENEVEALARQYRFFHWHLAFPQVFDHGGFACILGNPPWETIKLHDKEWFASSRPDIAEAPNTAARDRLICDLRSNEPLLFKQYQNAKRIALGSAHILSSSGAYPLCSCGDLNTFGLFAELARVVLASYGRLGCVLPTGIVTDDPYKHFFHDVITSKSLVSVFDFENQKPHFADVKRTTKFCLFTALSKNSRIAYENPEFLFFGYDTPDLLDTDRRFALSAEAIERINPNTKTCPVFRSRSDAALTGFLHTRHPVLVAEGVAGGNPWQVDFTTLFHMSGDSALFRFYRQIPDRERHFAGSWIIGAETRWAPLFEQNLFHSYDHRFASYGLKNSTPSETESDYLDTEMHTSQNFVSIPRYWISELNLNSRWEQKGLQRSWSLAFRQSARTVDSRTGIFCILPKVASGHSVHLAEVGLPDARMSCARLAEWNSFIWDYLFRQSLGGNNTSFFILKQVAAVGVTPIKSPSQWSDSTVLDWLLPRVLELTYTAWDLEAFAADCGWSGPPFRWDEERRFLLRCELDAAFFHLYLGPQSEWQQQPEALTRAFPTPRHAASYIMDTFPIVKRKDEARTQETNAAGEVTKQGRYITKDTILEIYDALAEAQRTGQPYVSKLDPKPGPPVDANGAILNYADIPESSKPHIHPPRGESSCDGTVSLTELRGSFPEGPFKIRIGLGTDSIIRSAAPVTTESIKTGDEIVLSHPNLKLGDRQIPAAIGKPTIAQRLDAATGQPFVHITIQTTEGLAQARMPEQEWREHKLIGILKPQ